MPRSRTRVTGAAAIVLPLCWIQASAADDPPIAATVIDVATDYSWGYRLGVKQPVGSYRLGRSIHQISRRVENPDGGSPDFLVWIDEHAGVATILENPVGQQIPPVVNPGGTSVFTSNPGSPAEAGRVWFAYGARANDLPLDIARSTMPNDPTAFDVVLDDFITDQGSTTPCLHVRDDELLFTYRNGGSSWAKTTVRFQRYRSSDLLLQHEADIGKGFHDPDLGNFGIEQLWTRYDPRHDKLAATWQWFYVEQDRFGCNPFVYTDDEGMTWRRADGSTLDALPVDYSQIDPVLVPFNHLATPNENTNWLVSDIGLTPGDGAWMTLPSGNAYSSNDWTVYFWLWNGAAWEHRELTEGLWAGTKPHATVTTRDYIVIAYSQADAPNVLLARASRDEGRTWSDPVVVDQLEDHSNGSPLHFCWVSAIQPAERYLDNTARFIAGYYQYQAGVRAQRYRNSIRSIRIGVGLRADFNADDRVDTSDLIAFLNAWAANEWRADFSDDGDINTADVLAFLNAFGAER